MKNNKINIDDGICILLILSLIFIYYLVYYG